MNELINGDNINVPIYGAFIHVLAIKSCFVYNCIIFSSLIFSMSFQHEKMISCSSNKI